jgi:hypothetical protein
VQVTLFIKGVISDIQAYDNNRVTIQLRMNLQLASLEFFCSRFLDPDHELMLPGKLPVSVAEAICDLLIKMNKVLAEYRVLVNEYDLLDETDRRVSEESAVTKRVLLMQRRRKSRFNGRIGRSLFWRK